MSRDRNYDVTGAENARIKSTRYFQDGTLSADFSPSFPPMARSRRKRVTSGGPATPEREKPYLFWDQQETFPQGKIVVKKGYGAAYTVYQGNLNVNTSTGSGGNLDTAVRFPLEGTPKHFYSAKEPLINPDLLSQAEVKALNKLRKKSGQADLDFGLWFGERKETAELFTRVAVGISSMAKALARKDLRASANVMRDAFGVIMSRGAEKKRLQRLKRYIKKETRRGLKSTSLTLGLMQESILAYNLGAAPLVEDLKTAHMRFLTGDLTSKMAVKAVSRHSHTQNAHDFIEREAGNIRQSATLAHTHGYTVTLIATPIHSAYADLSRLGFANPTNTIYQLIGGSFLLDYILAMGPFLEACTVPQEFTFSEGSWTHRLIVKVTTQIWSPVGKTTIGEYRCNYFRRYLYGSFPVPIPPLSFKGKDLSFKQTLNVGLIAISDFRRLVGL